MQILEQKKFIDELKDYRSKMTRTEQYDFDIFQKRQKDEEDFDTISFGKLKELHKKYVKKITKEDAEKLFKKHFK